MDRSLNKSVGRGGVLVDAGLRVYMQKVFSTMGLGLALTGLVAYVVASTPALYGVILGTPLVWVLLIATLAVPVTLGASIGRLRASTAQMLFWGYAALMGATTSSVFLIYAMESVARVFLITSCMFGGMSLYGYTTKRDLTNWGSFLFMGVLGLVLASVVNLFVGSTPLQMALSVVAVLVFTGLTAYDVQMIARLYQPSAGEDVRKKSVVLGALSLYLDFINMFFALLRLFGDRR
ncbi:Bax inhibitor-1/YccA family protein [Candidatus Hepatobacter penaei]|uniref:Bax inhibitor-1/YccA family protein n=1 Tax=Candidatus Hepatobacter penaei TaxID=1274402 RepID=UPI0004F26E46|nr:Bax inhibitor-1/YccA family protein [Candidatus Hepatobacter penaei]